MNAALPFNSTPQPNPQMALVTRKKDKRKHNEGFRKISIQRRRHPRRCTLLHKLLHTTYIPSFVHFPAKFNKIMHTAFCALNWVHFHHRIPRSWGRDLVKQKYWLFVRGSYCKYAINDLNFISFIIDWRNSMELFLQTLYFFIYLCIL